MSINDIVLTTDSSILTAVGNDYGYNHVFAWQVETSQNGGHVADNSEICIKVSSGITARIQEAHILIGHIFCQMIEVPL